ncbi:hypothetical protein [Actinocrispum sp. NPDC049592]|uniref:hypothetical protein n=1 Tax=Actinocrispum sp. NPDC049592 TaxID=3154835 RepID=UPI0034302828
MTMRWAARCLYAEAVFQIVIAVLLWLNWEPTVNAFIGTAFAPNRDAAEGTALGAEVVHVVLAGLSVWFATRLPKGRVRATVVMALVAVGGVAAMKLPSQTYLSPIGVAIAIAAIVLMWVRSSVPRPESAHRR